MNERFRLNSEMIEGWRAQKDLTQEDLAKKLKIGVATVGRMLGGSVPRWTTVKRLAALMGVEADELLLPREGARAS